MEERRIIGLDLGIASEHTARVLDGQGQLLAKRKAVPTVESLTTLEQAALEGAPARTVLEVVIEPTGPAWLPIAVFFLSRGHRVFRVSYTRRHHDLRKLLLPPREVERHRRRHARPPGPRRTPRQPASTQAPKTPIAPAFDRRVRSTDRLAPRGERSHKVRIKDLVRQLYPMSPLHGDLVKADLAVLERFADPRDAAPGRASPGSWAPDRPPPRSTISDFAPAPRRVAGGRAGRIGPLWRASRRRLFRSRR